MGRLHPPRGVQSAADNQPSNILLVSKEAICHNTGMSSLADGEVDPGEARGEVADDQLHAAANGEHGPHVPDVPPFWVNGPPRHQRTVSSVSYHSLNEARPAAISLEDHSADSNDLTQSCWARSASIDEYVVVSGPTGIGAYVVWHCTVQTLKGGDLQFRKRCVGLTLVSVDSC